MTFEPTFTYAAAVGCANFASLWLMFAYLSWHGRKQNLVAHAATANAALAAATTERTEGRLAAAVDEIKVTAGEAVVAINTEVRHVAADLALTPPRP